LAVGAGLGSGHIGDVRRAELQAKHGQCASAGLGEDFRQENLAKILDFDDVVLGVGTRQLRLDLFDQGTNGHLTILVDARYFPGFLVGGNSTLQVVVGLALHEEVVAQSHFDRLTIDNETFKATIVRSDVPFDFIRFVLGGKATDDAFDLDAIEDVERFDGGRSVRDKGAVFALLAGDMGVGGLKANEILEVEVQGVGRGVATNRRQGRGSLRLNQRPDRVAEFTTKCVAFGMEVKRNTTRQIGHRGQYLGSFEKFGDLESYPATDEMQ